MGRRFTLLPLPLANTLKKEEYFYKNSYSFLLVLCMTVKLYR